MYFTINTGQDIHLICEQKDVEAVRNMLKDIEEVKNIIVNTPGEDTKLVNTRLF